MEKMSSIVIGCRYNPYTNKKTGEFKDVYQLFVVSPIYSNGEFAGYGWPIDYQNLKAFKSMPLQVDKAEFESWGLTPSDMIYRAVNCFYDGYGNLSKVIPVIEK